MSKWIWIAQDAEGRVCKFLEKVVPVNGYLFWEKYPEKYKVVQEHGERNPNWKDTLINLETEDYEIVDGILKRLPRKTELDKLIARVKLIDKKAAKWINKNRHKCADIDDICEALPDWFDCKYGEDYWCDIANKLDLQIKPKNTIRYRVARFGDTTANAHDACQENEYQKCLTFSEWLTDWIEVEV